MTGTIDLRLSSEHPDKNLDRFYVFADSPSSPRIVNVPATIGSWDIENVIVSVTYPDGTVQTKEAVGTEGTYVATIPSCHVAGVVNGGFQVLADGVDESGEPFEGLCLGVGDLEVLPRDGTIRRGGTTTVLHLVEEMPEVPRRGEATVIDGHLMWYDGESWCGFGGNNHSTFNAVRLADEDTGDVYVLKIKGGELKIYMIS